VGGNHEAANHLRELYVPLVSRQRPNRCADMSVSYLCQCRYYGGWAAPNIYFLGYSGVVNYGGLRIGGFSGIYKRYDFFKGTFMLRGGDLTFADDHDRL
jgi:lariat debranching enzyme